MPVTRSPSRPPSGSPAYSPTDLPAYRGGSSFSPLDLFKSGDIGAALPIYLATMWQDANGSVDLTAAGQTYALRLDYSKNLAYGSQLLTSVDDLTTDWVLTNGSGSASVDTDTFNSAGANDGLHQDHTTVVGRLYEFKVFISSSTGATMRLRVGNDLVTYNLTGGAQELTIKHIATATTTRFQIRGVATAFSVTLSNAYAKELQGNHAYQKTPANEPTYQESPARTVYGAGSLTVGFPSSLGSDCTVAIAVPNVGAYILTGQTVGTSYTSTTDECYLFIIDRALTAGETARLTVFLDAVASGSPAAVFAREVSYIGDSRIAEAQVIWKSVTFPSGTGTNAQLGDGYCTGQGITADSVGGGTLEFRVSDDSFRWTAPGDTAGAWTPAVAGWNFLESATAGMGIAVPQKDLDSLPAGDESYTVSVTGTPSYRYQAKSPYTRVQNLSWWLGANPKNLAIGGNQTSHVVAQLDYINGQSSGAGFDVVQLSTNDISGEVALATITSNYGTILDDRLSRGRRIILIGEPARWGSAVDDPMTETQQTLLAGINAWLLAYAASHANVWFVDTYSLTVDNAFSDGRPAAGFLRDRVHYSDYGAQVAGQAVADLILSIAGRGDQRGSGSSGNLLTNGYMSGDGGTVGTGCTGTAPDSWTVQRITGSDATATVSVVERTDGISGNWLQLEVSATSGDQVIQANLPSQTLASLGLSVGDDVYTEAEIQVEDASGGLVEANWSIVFVGPGYALDTQRYNAPDTDNRQTDEHSIRRSQSVAIPATTTGLRGYFLVRTNGACTATVRIGSAAIIEVT